MSRRKDEILLSPKHGLNPSMQLCFYCGECKGIALMGKLKDDKEAPRECVTDLEPCDKCKEKYKEYSLIIEKDTCDDSLPTGRWFAIKKEALIDENLRKHPILFMDILTFNSVIENMKNKE